MHEVAHRDAKSSGHTGAWTAAQRRADHEHDVGAGREHQQERQPGEGDEAAVYHSAAGAAFGVPHSGQNFALSGTAAPHSVQNAFCASF